MIIVSEEDTNMHTAPRDNYCTFSIKQSWIETADQKEKEYGHSHILIYNWI